MLVLSGILEAVCAKIFIRYLIFPELRYSSTHMESDRGYNHV